MSKNNQTHTPKNSTLPNNTPLQNTQTPESQNSANPYGPPQPSAPPPNGTSFDGQTSLSHLDPTHTPSPIYSRPASLKEKLNFDSFDGVFALLYTLLGFLFAKFSFFNVPIFYGLGTSLFFIGLIILSVIYLKKSKISFSIKDVFLLAIPLIFALNLSYTSKGLIKFLIVVFLLLYCAYYIYAKGHSVKKTDDYFFFHLLKSSVILPISYFSSAARSISYTLKQSESKKIKWILAGLAITLPVTSLVASLLFSGDIMFQEMFSSLFYNSGEYVLQNIFLFALGIPFSFLLFSAAYSSKTKKGDKVLPKERVDAFKTKTKVLSPYLFYAALTPLCILYIMFFFAQSGYFLSAFQNLLPKDFSYSQYARQGFFELCTVAAINLVIVLVIILFCKQEKNKINKPLKTYCIIFCCFTILLLITAISKMAMYMHYYGLTQLRVYTTWFMLLLGFIFLLIILNILISRLPLQRILVVVFVLHFAVLSFSNIDGIIAKSNIERYQKGEIGWMDASILHSLSDGAVQYILPLYLDENTNDEVKHDCEEYLEDVYYRYNNDIFYNNFTSFSAYQSLKEINFETKVFDY